MGQTNGLEPRFDQFRLYTIIAFVILTIQMWILDEYSTSISEVDTLFACLKVGCCIDWSGLMILVQSRPERGVVGASGCTKFVLVGVGIVEVIIMKVLLLAPDTPSSVCQSRKQ